MVLPHNGDLTQIKAAVLLKPKGLRRCVFNGLKDDWGVGSFLLFLLLVRILFNASGTTAAES